MICDVDAAVQTWLSRFLPREVPVVLDPPHRCAGRTGEMLSAFLDDIEEDPTGSPASWSEVRNAAGDLIGRQPPGRRYRFSYLITAWAADTAREHRLLGEIMLGCAGSLALPRDVLAGALARNNQPIPVRSAPRHQGPEPFRNSFGETVRTSIRLELLVPYVPDVQTGQDPAPRQVAVHSSVLPPARRGRRGISEG